MYVENMVKVCFKVLLVILLTVIGSNTSVVAGRKKPHVTKSNDVMVLEYEFEEPDVTTKGGIDFVTISGFKRYNKAGEPVIPVKPVQILIPAGMKIKTVTSQAMDTYQLPGTYLLAHGTEQFRKDLGPPKTPTQPNPDIYSMTTFWPAQQHELVTVQSNRGYNIAHVILFPLQYAPKDGKIKMAAKMQLKICFTSIDSPRGAKPTKALKKKLQRKLDNPDTMESYDDQTPLPPTKGPGDPLSDPGGPYYGANYDYVVITTAALAGISDPYSFQGLCDSKAPRGINAGIVTTDWILANYDGTRPSGGSDNATKIRNFLIDAYQTWGTEYALLAGDKDIIPARFFRASGADIPADLYYGCVDPPDCTFDEDGDGTYGESNDGPGGGDVDLSADILVGRAGVENTTEVIYFVKKTLFYGSTSDTYLDHTLSSGGYLGFNGIQEFSKPFCELVRFGSDLYLGHFAAGFESPGIVNPRDFTVTTLYDEDWWNENMTPYYDSATAGPGDGVNWGSSHGWNATTDLLPILNGTGGNTTPQLIYCGDHGAPHWGFTKLTTQPTSQNNCDCICNLTNTRPFFFYDDSCQVGQFTIEDCFSEEMTVGIEYGAFACITLSKAGFGASGNNLDSVTTMFTREFFHSVLGKGIFELGAALQESRDSCLWRSGMGGFRYAYFEEILFGDPELQLRVAKDSCPYTCGDHDGASVNVNMADFGLFASCWGKDPSVDLNCGCANLVEFDDHIIDLLDLSVFAELFLSNSQSRAPACSTSIIDPYAPTPDPMTWETEPAATGDSSISMTAVEAFDSSGVEYYFTCTAGDCNDSGWQVSTSYEDTGLLPETTYTYTVKARDLSDNYNKTDPSAEASATTHVLDLVAPVPDPMTWETEPDATGETSITMVATTATDSSGVEYYFDETSGNPGGSDSGWQDSASYTDTDLIEDTLYTYTVTARDKSYTQNVTAPSPEVSATTDPHDFPPSFVDAGIDMITGSGQTVQLAGTVLDEGLSALTYAWSANPAQGVVFSDETFEDPTVTITKPTGAVPIAILNAGFEKPVHDDGQWSHEHPDWSEFGSGSAGILNPDATGEVFYGYGGNTPEGQNAGWVSDDAGLAQVLTETFTADTTYTLTVEVGNSYYYSWNGYKIQLLAGATVLAEDDSSVTIATDTFETSTVTYDYNSAHAGLLGQNLEIRLFANGSGEVEFDDVRLVAAAAGMDMATFTLTLSVHDVGNPTPVEDTMTIDVHDEIPLDVTLDIDKSWMYQNLPGQTNSNFTAGVSITNDPSGNSSYSYQWEFYLPSDVTTEPSTLSGGGSDDQSWTFAAPSCNEQNGISDSGQAFAVTVTVTGNDHGNIGSAHTYFGIALLGDVNNDTTVNVADYSIANAFWQTGSAGNFSFRDCDLNSDGSVDAADPGIANAVWQGTLGQNSVSNPCPFRQVAPDMLHIPGGEFEMGDHFDEGYLDELPVHTVWLDEFFMDRYEITNQQYCDYLNSALAGGSIYLSDNVVYGTGNDQGYCNTSASSSYSQIVYSEGVFTVNTKDGRDMSNDPMVQVSWYGATAYCNWRSVQEGYRACYNLNTLENYSSKHGYRLATEAEWEYAARGGNHSPYYRYPWGDSIDGSKANYWDSGDPYETGDFPWTTPAGYYDAGQIPAGSDMANGYGLYDMTGNAWEWCNDWYDENYYDVSPYDNPTGPAGGSYRVFRGGAWGSLAAYCRVAYRLGDGPSGRYSIVGFRIVLDY